MATFFISDLHITSDEDPKAKLLEAFLVQVPKRRDSLLLGGDIFNLYVGNKEVFWQRYRKSISAIKVAASRGIQIHYVEGNHDFLLKNVFSDTNNIDVHENAFALDAEGLKLWVDHGDLLHPQDYGYKLLRFVTRTWAFRLFLALMPSVLVGKIGDWSSKTSRKFNYEAGMSEDQKQYTRNFCIKAAQEKIESGVDVVLVGHTHLADFEKFQTPQGLYVNLGFAADYIPYLRLGSDISSAKVENFSPKN